MSSYGVIRHVSRRLRQLLWEEFLTDPDVLAIVPNDQAVVFSNPTDTARRSSDRLSLWLYQVTENEFLKNQAETRVNGADTRRRAPLALDLHYLITPFAGSGESDLLLLGKTLQILHDSASTVLRISDEQVGQELRIVFVRHTLEELTRIWEALQEPYRLSVSYLVTVVEIDSLRTDVSGRVLDRVAGFNQDPAAVRREEP